MNGRRKRMTTDAARRNARARTRLERKRRLARNRMRRYRKTAHGRAAQRRYEQRPTTKAANRIRRRARRLRPEVRAQDLLDRALARARETRGLKCLLTKAQIVEKLRVGKCALSGLSFDFAPSDISSRNPLAPSLDRIDSNGHYTDGNTRVVCCALNAAISEWGLAQYLTIARAVIKRQDCV